MTEPNPNTQGDCSTMSKRLDDIPTEVLAGLIGHAETCDHPIADCSACATLYGLEESDAMWRGAS